MKTDPPQRDWVIFLSKPNENDNHLLMTITDEERKSLGLMKLHEALTGWLSAIVRPKQPMENVYRKNIGE